MLEEDVGSIGVGDPRTWMLCVLNDTSPSTVGEVWLTGRHLVNKGRTLDTT